MADEMNDGDFREELYLDLLKRTLINLVYLEYEPAVREKDDGENRYVRRIEGRDWPCFAHTVVGMSRLNNIQYCIERIHEDGVPGDLLETGVWRGGAAIFMRGVLKACGATDRCVWAADSFQGLPEPDAEKYPVDKNDKHHTSLFLRVSLEQVQENFRKYGLLDDQVKFIKGWFESSLSKAPIKQLALLRLDGDMYGSTMTVFEQMYHRVAPGGFIIVDDYGAVSRCRQAVKDFREKENITEPLQMIDWTGQFWRKRAKGA